MKKIVLLATTICFSTTLLAAGNALKTEAAKQSYSIGADIGAKFKAQDITVDSKAFQMGFEDAYSGTTKLKQEEISKNLTQLQSSLNEKRKIAFKKNAEMNLNKGKTFLEENKKNKDIVVLDSGLQYKIIESGDKKADSPKSGDTVTTHYRGTFIDGKEFDSSHKRGQPASFPVDAVIAGWTEALKLMHPGDKWQLFVPANLAYGEHGAGNIIGPNEALIFEVELISVEKAKKN